MSKQKHPKSVRGLARALGVSHVAIGGWKKRFAGQAPKGRDVGEWQRFIDANGLAEAQRAGVLSDLRHAKLREVQLRCEGLRRQLARDDKQVMMVSEVNKLLGQVGTKLRYALLAGIESHLPPRLDGQPAVEVRRILRDWCDDVFGAMQDAIDQSTLTFGFPDGVLKFENENARHTSSH